MVVTRTVIFQWLSDWGKLIRILGLGLVILVVFGGCQPLIGITRHPQSDVIHLTRWQGINPPPNRDVFQKLVDRFNREHPQIQVESLYIGQPDQQLPKILAAVVGNAAPDMLWFSPMLTGRLWELNAIQPLDAWLAKSPLLDQIDPALLESMQMQGRTWSVPFGTNNVGIFYRPSLLQVAGITQLPETWDQLRQVARQLTRDTNGDGKVDQHGILLSLGKGEWTVFTWLPFLWSAGGELLQKSSSITHGNSIEMGRGVTVSDRPSVNLVNGGAIAALQFWQDLLKDGSAVLSEPERGYELDSFLAGKVAMQLTGPWTLGQLQATGVDFAVMPIPAQTERATAIGGENLFILKTTPDHEQAAQVFAEYVLGESFQTEWALETGYLPGNLESRKSQAYQAFIQDQPAVKVFLEQAQYGRSRPITPGYNRISENLGRAIETTLLGKQTPTTALQEAQQRLDLIFK